MRHAAGPQGDRGEDTDACFDYDSGSDFDEEIDGDAEDGDCIMG